MLEIIIVFLGATLIAVPLFKWLKLGSILGYLCAGVLIGPSVFALVEDTPTILHLADLGVVLMLFVIGLELEPKKLWQMRSQILVKGGIQLLSSVFIIATVIYFWGSLSLAASAAIGLALALSSTAFAVQLMTEQKVLRTESGQTGFSILLMQDVAVIPILIIVAALAPIHVSESHPWWLGVGAIIGVLLIGFYLINPLLRIVSKHGSTEVMTAAALFIVLLTAYAMELAGLSMGMGAFLAGILLADSTFKHQLEIEIEPFKGLLLGLFFIAIGMNLELALLVKDPLLIVGGAIALMVVKAIIIAVIIRKSGQKWCFSTRIAIMLSQGGEFAFVIVTLCVSSALLTPDIGGIVNLIVGLSMALTSPAMILYGKWLNTLPSEPLKETNIGKEPANIIIAGFGRFGQITARILTANNTKFTAVDIDASHIEFVKRFGNKVYYGDATRLSLMKKAGIENCDILLIAMNEQESCTTLARLVKQYFPHVKLVVRARDRIHAVELSRMGVDNFVRETFFSGLEAARFVLTHIGHNQESIEDMIKTFKQHDFGHLESVINEDKAVADLLQQGSKGREALRDIFKGDTT